MQCCKRCRAVETHEEQNTKEIPAKNNNYSLKCRHSDKTGRYAKYNSTNVQNDEYLFCSKAEMNHSLKRLCYGNLYVIGKIWVEGLKSVLVGSEFCLVPKVKAAPAEPEKPKKPPPMKYTDLSVYSAPHYEYKECIRDVENKCDEEDKTLHSYLYPKVKENRQAFSDFISESYTKIGDYVGGVKEVIRNTKDRFLCEARHPDNYLARNGFVASSAVLGFIMGRRLGTHKDSILKGILVSSLAILASGALCFPEETDLYFRNVCYYSARTGLGIYNKWANDNIQLEKNYACESESNKISRLRKSKCPPTECPPNQ